ncbi:uncharacterized protein LOC134854161 isoform X2 [Symsagittifera roscoffensis]|uniref:uncharacterized protein LOC134854161 isoform X2 n=1 Tax=Symsagittifera roscoffensis TaxID=84072 RepID=UPI00307BF478
MVGRNKIVEHKLKVYGRKVNLKPLDLCPNLPNYAGSCSSSDQSPRLLSPGNVSMDLHENDFQEFDGVKKQFDVFDLEQLVTLLENRFSSINIPVDYGICVSFICPESTADEKTCLFKCDELFRAVRKSLGNWRCKAFTEHISTNCKLVTRKQALNPIPFLYEGWWFPEFVDKFRLDREVSLCPITQSEVENPEKPWMDGNDVIMVSPLDRSKLERRGSSGQTGSMRTAQTNPSSEYSTTSSSDSPGYVNRSSLTTTAL